MKQATTNRRKITATLAITFAVSYSGDKLLYAGACMRGPHNDPFFEWGPKVPGR